MRTRLARRMTTELVAAFRYNQELTEHDRADLLVLAEAIMSAAAQGWPEHGPASAGGDDLDL